MGKLENRLRETISDLQEKHNEIVELGEEKLRERDEYLAPLIGRLEEMMMKILLRFRMLEIMM